MRRNLAALAKIVGLILVLTSCGSKSSPTSPSGGTTTSATIQIAAVDYTGSGTASFAPTVVNVSVNGSVTWQNNDSIAHTSTSNNSAWDGAINPGQSFTRTFSTAGTFPFHCTVHSTMTGQVIVK